jgi:hypothetical protein
MHLFRGADNGINWAGLNAKCAANTQTLVDDGNCSRLFDTVVGIQRYHSLAQNFGQTCHARSTAGRALIVGGNAARHCFRIRATAIEPTFGALGLRQGLLECIGKREVEIFWGHARLPRADALFWHPARIIAYFARLRADSTRYRGEESSAEGR